jgi:hypothetical protein
MAFFKQRRDKFSLVGLLRSLLTSPPPQFPSKVAQPGARPKKPDVAPPSSSDSAFGKRRPRKRHR